MRDEYTTLHGIMTHEVIIKGSRFIAVAAPCSSESDLDALLSKVRSEYPNATHYCYAATFDSNDRFSDNGEPSGTAGRSILQVVKGSGIDDLAIIIIRYFGGTLLGTGGLVQAYSGSASDVLKGAESIRYVRSERYRISLTYSEFNVFQSSCSSLCSVAEQGFSENVTLVADVPLKNKSQFIKVMMDLTKGGFMQDTVGAGYCAEK